MIEAGIMDGDYILVEQQNTAKKLEAEVAQMTDRVETIKLAIARLEDQLNQMAKRMQDAPPTDLAKAQEAARNAQKLLSDLEDYEKEMRTIQKDAANHEKAEKDIRVKFAKVKAEYDKQKEDYEAESKELKKELEQKRKEAEEKTAGLEPALLEKYRAIKQHCTPPVAKLYSGQCMGCNMSLPQATLRKLKNDSGIIECENCGRMLIQM
jgi:predicted  nucleic acid-binding Zn-ribbon protein